MYNYKYENCGASFSTVQAASAFAGALSVSFSVKDIESTYHKNRYGIVSVWFMIQAETHVNKAAELSALAKACEEMYK